MPRRRDLTGLDAKLCDALAHLERGDQYKGYLCQLVRECIDRLIAGDPEAATHALRGLNLPLHAAERLPTTFQGLEAATWMRAAAQFLEVVLEASQHNPRLKQKLPALDRHVLAVLRDVDPPKPIRRTEVWRRVNEYPRSAPATEAQVGQALTRCHDRLWVVRLEMHGPEGAYYQIATLGREALECSERN